MTDLKENEMKEGNEKNKNEKDIKNQKLKMILMIIFHFKKNKQEEMYMKNIKRKQIAEKDNKIDFKQFFLIKTDVCMFQMLKSLRIDI